jgi:hypothetical protein
MWAESHSSYPRNRYLIQYRLAERRWSSRIALAAGGMLCLPMLTAGGMLVAAACLGARHAT